MIPTKQFCDVMPGLGAGLTARTGTSTQLASHTDHFHLLILNFY